MSFLDLCASNYSIFYTLNCVNMIKALSGMFRLYLCTKEVCIPALLTHFSPLISSFIFASEYGTET